MTRIVVLSDTHIPLVTKKLPRPVIDELKRADLCIHAGDYIENSVIKAIEKHTAFRGVRGNMDTEQLRKKLPEKLVFEIESVRIGVTHGSGAPNGIRERVAASFKKDKADLIIFGHSHQAYMERHDGCLYLNPGSPTDIFYTRVNTFGIVEIDGKNIAPSIVKV